MNLKPLQLTGSNFAVVAAVDLIVEIIINAAIQESKGEFKGTPSSEIVPYDPKHDTPENNRDEKVCYTYLCPVGLTSSRTICRKKAEITPSRTIFCELLRSVGQF